ncbi:hypothetical protein [Atlantibacter sp.]|uniref:hypothetical protein n=1 Tax=Atlantibacter sp. TaxID=1903473 RepID=UPI0028ADDED3|nr:hypothetical protein [Atlantibacter sp.]
MPAVMLCSANRFVVAAGKPSRQTFSRVVNERYSAIFTAAGSGKGMVNRQDMIYPDFLNPLHAAELAHQRSVPDVSSSVMPPAGNVYSSALTVLTWQKKRIHLFILTIEACL